MQNNIAYKIAITHLIGDTALFLQIYLKTWNMDTSMDYDDIMMCQDLNSY